MPKVFDGNRIHLIEKETNYQRLDDDSGLWESKWWRISKLAADQLVSGALYLHKMKSKRSFYGGIIEGYRLESDGEYAGRVIFLFRPSLEFKDVNAGAEGWGQEKKTVFPKNQSAQSA